MTPRIVLDPSGENPVDKGYVRLATEVEFLRQDSAQAKLWIVGERLCRWVESIYRVRQADELQTLRSPREQLYGLVGAAADALNSKVVERVVSIFSQGGHRLCLADVLTQLTGIDLFLYHFELVMRRFHSWWQVSNLPSRLEICPTK